MKCPHCEHDIPGKTCPNCGTTTPGDAQFCMNCGNSFGHAAEQPLEDEYEEDFDFEDRVLCPDGTCTGIIVDGRCTECGKTPKPEELEEATA